MVLQSIEPNGYSIHNRAKLLHGGIEYFNFLEELLNAAKVTIHLQFYIYENDATGNRITQLLTAAAARGVKVYILLDAYASSSLGDVFGKNLEQQGIYFRWFEPLFRNNNFYFGRRLHHKVVVVDGVKALVGGMNISDRYNDMPGIPAWLDWAVFVEGEVAAQLNEICRRLFFKRVPQKNNNIKKLLFEDISNWNCAVAIRRNDWVNRYNQISMSYIKMLRRVEKQVIIMSSYFQPGRVIRQYLRKATTRGVEIILIVAGISDIALSKLAERYLYRWLLRNNVTIFEYNKSILHRKLSLYDDKWATIGSYNVNNLSAYASVELNLDISDKIFVKGLRLEIEKIIQNDCKKITKNLYDFESNIFQQLLQWVAYNFYKFTLFVFTFYFKQKD
jgi:cardiolipin synthase